MTDEYMTTSEVARLRGYTAPDGTVTKTDRVRASQWCRRRDVRRGKYRSPTGEVLWNREDVEHADALPLGTGQGNRAPRTDAQRAAAAANIRKAHAKRAKRKARR